MADYDRIAEIYFQKRQEKRFDYNASIERPAMIKMIGPVKGKAILDIGCGFGDHARFLGSYRRFVGFDLSKRLIDLADKQRIPNAEFYVGDMSKKFKHKNSEFDIVFSSLAIHYVKDIRRLFREVFRVLKKNGIFCFSTGHPIFNMLNRSGKISIERTSKGKDILGDYFDEGYHMNDLGSLGKVKLRNLTFETLVKAGLDAGFTLCDYVDARPIPSSKRLDAWKYRLTTTLPTFVIFKFKKS